MIKISNINLDFERFLNEEKDNFCKFRCLHSGGKTTVAGCGGCVTKCIACEFPIDLDEEDIEIEPCDYCVLNDFIREIRDSEIKVLERR